MLLYVKVKPNQRSDKVEKLENAPGYVRAYWQIRLKAPAVDGKANEHLVAYLSEILELPKSKIVLKKGQTSRIKCLEISMEEQVVISKLNQQSDV